MSGVFQEFAQEVAQETEQKTNEKTALRMLENGSLSLEEIAFYTNLSIAEVQALAAQREPA